MKENDVLRREFLKLISSGALFAFAQGCSSDGSKPVTAREALTTIILAIGPWGEDRRDMAEDFAKRFLAAQGNSSEVLSQGESAKSLMDRVPFRNRPLALDTLDLSGFSETERNMLVSLVTQIYGLLEVHYFHVAGMPDIGVCGGTEWFSRPPSEW